MRNRWAALAAALAVWGWGLQSPAEEQKESSRFLSAPPPRTAPGGALSSPAEAAATRRRFSPETLAAMRDQTRRGREPKGGPLSGKMETARRLPPAKDPGGGPVPMVACSENVTLTSGVPYDGTTVGFPNNMGSGANAYQAPFNWDESGPEVVHKITLTQTSDIRAAFLYLEPGVDLDIFIMQPCNSGNVIWWGDYVSVVENAPAGDYYVVVDGYQGAKGAYTLLVSAASGILLVDDDGSSDPEQSLRDGGGPLPNVRPYYTDALGRLGISYNVWDTGFLGSPDATTLYNYKTVMWVCGASWESGKTITTEDQNNLAGFIYNGGRLYMEGQDIIYDLMNGQNGRTGDGTFLDWMSVNAVTQDIGASGDTISGSLGDPIGDDANPATAPTSFTLTGGIHVQHGDSLHSRFGEAAFYDGDKRPAAVRYTDTVSRTLFLAFSPVNDGSTAKADALIGRSITWLSEVSYCFWDVSGLSESGGFTGDANGYADPGETMNFSLTVQNDSGAKATVEAYLAVQDPWLTVTKSYNSYGSINNGKSASATFTFQVSPSAPVGYEMNLTFNVFMDGVHCHSITFGSFVGQAQILLVKDEVLFPNTTGVDAYTGVLQQLRDMGYGYTAALWDTARFGSPKFENYGLANDWMKNYWMVMWFTGADFFFTLDAADEAEMTLYLNNGGRMLLSSQDYLWEKMGGASGPTSGFPLTHLKTGSVTQDTVTKGGALLTGVPGEWLTEFTNYNLADGQVFANFADTVTPAGGGKAIQTANGQPASIFYRGPGGGPAEYRLVFMPYAFENVADSLFPNAKWRFMEKLLCYFQQGSPSTPPPCGYYGPATVGDTLAIGGAGEFLWDSVAQNTAGEGATLQYRVYRSTNPNLTPAQWLAQPYTIRATPDYDPSGDGDGPVIFYKVAAVDQFGTVSEDDFLP